MYLQKKKVYIIYGLEFGSYVDRPAIVVKDLYDLKSSGARFIDHFIHSLIDVGVKSCLADPEVWMKTNTKLDGFRY